MSAPRNTKRSLKPGLVFAGVCVAIGIIAAAAFFLKRPPSNSTSITQPHVVPEQNDKSIFAGYAGSASCKACHEAEYDLWRKSHHGLAERPVDPALDSAAFHNQPKIIHASQISEAVASNGTFQIITTGLDGKRTPFTPARVIGVDPLRQFMIPAEGGRFQVTELAFDPIHTNWFDVYGEEDRKPGEWGHWTGRGMMWNSMCAACHNTRIRKHYDEASDSYHTTMAEMSVSCESCHGPMTAHNAWQKANGQKPNAGPDPTVNRLSRDQTLATCASCHSRRADLTGDFVPGGNYYDHFALSIPDETDLFYPDGQIRDEDYEFTAFRSSRMHAAGVRCVDCHDSHSGKTRVPGNALCMMCHASGRSVSPAPTQAAAKIQPAPVIDPLTHTHHKSGEAGDRCVDCHMPVTQYMQRHGRHDHGFTIPDPLLTREAGIPNACARCHADRGVDWAVAAVDKWYGKKMERPSRERTRMMVRAKAGDSKSPAELTQSLHAETNGFWRAVAAGFLRRWAGDSNVVAALVVAANDPDPLTRSMAVRSLELAERGPEVDRVLRARLEDSARSVRIDAAWALRQTLETNSVAGADLLAYLKYAGDQPSGAMQMGVLNVDRGNIAEAIRYLRKAVMWDTNSVPSRHALAVALSMNGDSAEAVEQLRAACRLAPRDAEMRFRLGLALSEAGQPDAARSALEEAVKLDPRFARAWYNLGLMYNSSGQPDAALEALLRAEGMDGEDAQIPYARATIFAREGRVEEAKKAARRALEIRPDYNDAANLLESLNRGQ